MARERDDEYDDRPPRRRDRELEQRDDYADDPSTGGPSRRPVSKGINVCGLIALIMGAIGLVLALIPCIGVIGIPVAAVGLLLGVIGLFTSGKTTGRGLPIAGTCVSLAGLIIGGAWLALFAVTAKNVKEDVEQAQVRFEQQMKEDEAKRKAAEKEFREGKATTVTAQQLDKDYDENAVSADRKYKDKVLEISGKVARVNRDRFGKSWVEFDVDESTAIIKCEFGRDSQDDLAKVDVKKNVVIRGKCKGKTVGRGKKEDEIVLTDCFLVSKVAP
jgi:hypothetical protein